MTPHPNKALNNIAVTNTPLPETALTWRIHLLRQHPDRLPALLLVLFIGVLCVWLLCGNALPVIAAVTLLLGSASEYLFPITYRLSDAGVTARGANGLLALSWKEVRRCLQDPAGLIVTSLPASSRLDRFRGVLLRYAPDGESGDRASVLAALELYAPELAVSCRIELDGYNDTANVCHTEGAHH